MGDEPRHHHDRERDRLDGRAPSLSEGPAIGRRGLTALAWLETAWVGLVFDLEALHSAANAERDRQGLSWAALSRQIGVAASTIRRFEHAEDAEADGVLAVVRWLQSAPEDYMSQATVTGTPLANGHKCVRVDMEMVAIASGDPGGANGRSRTTIQNLARVASQSRRPVASLTRLSDV